MTSTTEELFAAFPVRDRLLIVEALQLRVTDTDVPETAERCAALLAAIGYPESADAAQRVRASGLSAAGDVSIVDRIAEYSVRA